MTNHQGSTRPAWEETKGRQGIDPESLIYIEVKIDKIAFLDFLHTFTAALTGASSVRQ